MERFSWIIKILSSGRGRQKKENQIEGGVTGIQLNVVDFEDGEMRL